MSAMKAQLDSFARALAQRRKLLALQNERTSLRAYCAALFPGFQCAAHHAEMIAALEEIERGECPRLACCEPPRHGKSTLMSQYFVGHYLGLYPERDVILISYGQDLADDMGRRVRNLLSDPRHMEIFPASRLRDDSASMRRFDLTAGGSFYAVGRGGPITGRGADLLVIDDPLKDREEAFSPTIRRSMKEFFRTVAFPRLHPTAAIVTAMTRWHEDDFIGWRLREHPEDGWRVLSFPAIAEADESFRKAGEPLWPSRYSLSMLKAIREAIGGAAWASLYQQRPAASEGAVFKRDWFRTYEAPPAKFKKIIQSWDCAFQTGRENDFSVGSTWGVTENEFYLLALWREKVEFPALKKQVASQADAWKPNEILIEKAASGQSLIQELRSSTRFPVRAVRVDSDKRSRAEAVTALFEAGKVFIPTAASAPWVEEYVEEMCTFPAAKHDDSVDSTTQALNHLRGKPIMNGWFFSEAARFAELRKECPAMALFELAQKNNLLPGSPGAENNMDPAELGRLQIENFNSTTTGRGFGAPKSNKMPTSRLSQPRSSQGPECCPKCGNRGLGRYCDWQRCACGWDSRAVAAPPPEPTPAKPQSGGSFDSILARLGF
jgi:predicted phage terminase large subunit-like protein